MIPSGNTAIGGKEFGNGRYRIIFFGIAFYVLGRIGLGRGKLGEGGVVRTCIGLINAIIGLHIALVGNDPLTSTLVFLFAIIWLTADWPVVKEYGLFPARFLLADIPLP